MGLGAPFGHWGEWGPLGPAWPLAQFGAWGPLGLAIGFNPDGRAARERIPSVGARHTIPETHPMPWTV